jgi:5-methylcytosine-specific restriction endonuclease McrA
MKIISHKICNKCKVEKPTSEFGELATSRDGHKHRCNSCINEFHISLRDKRNRRRTQESNNGVFYVSPEFLMNLYSSPCVACGGTEDIAADHVVSIARGGSYSELNLQPLCRTCNSSKGIKSMEEFRQSRPDLFS